MVATVELHSNQIWRDLGAFYSLVADLEKFLKIKKGFNSYNEKSKNYL